MPKASWNHKIVAETDKFETVEGNVYFPPDAIHQEFFQESTTHTICPWKGTASYYNIVVDGKINKDAAWYYPDPKPAARKIKGFVAFWRGVDVEK